ncbi:MAG: hypothetical protein GX931_05840 [Acholeplasmataceae bacterium]|jgi:hypothetical protein|nr:hypothetical protein [Acholeplasmataceae bacterium]
MKNMVSKSFGTKNYEIKIDISSLAVVSIYNKLTSDEYLKEKYEIPIFVLEGEIKGKWERINPKLKSIENNKLNVTFGDYDILGVISFETRDLDKAVFEITITNKDDFVINEIIGPNIYGLSLGDDYQKNVFIYPHHAGEKTVNPMDRYRKKDYQSFFRANTYLTSHNTYKRSINYCGLASMSFMYLYDENNGFYIGSHDKRFPVTSIVAEVGALKRFMGLSFIKHYNIEKDETYCSKEYVISINNKDWHYAKEIYRPYLLPHLKFHNYPKYLDDEWGLNQCYNFKRQGNIIQNKFKDIPKMFLTGKELGLKHMFLASWNRGGFDTDYPEYYPDMDLGSAMDFVRGLQFCKDNGGIPTLYINARIFDIESDYASSVGERMAIKKPDGTNYIETYGKKSFTISCPSDNEWKNRLIDTAEFLVKGYGAVGVYLDQLASAEPFACYQEKHSHKRIGEFNQGYLEVLKETLKRIKKINPNSFILTENIGDIYCSYTFANLTWNGPDYDEFFNLIKYIFPEFIQINMVNPRLKDKKYATEEETLKFHKHLERAILLGSILWYAPTIKRLECEKVMVDYLHQALLFRKEIQQYIKKTTFVDNKYLLDSEGVNVCIHENKDLILVLIGNAKNNTIKLKFPTEYKLKRAFDFQLKPIMNIKINEEICVIEANSHFSAILLDKKT